MFLTFQFDNVTRTNRHLLSASSSAKIIFKQKLLYYICFLPLLIKKITLYYIVIKIIKFKITIDKCITYLRIIKDNKLLPWSPVFLMSFAYSSTIRLSFTITVYHVRCFIVFMIMSTSIFYTCIFEHQV